MWDQGWFGKLMVITLGALIVFGIFQLLHCCIWHRNCVRRCRQKNNIFPPEDSMEALEKDIEKNETSWLCCCGKVKTSDNKIPDKPDNEDGVSHDIENPGPKARRSSSRQDRVVPDSRAYRRSSRPSRKTV